MSTEHLEAALAQAPSQLDLEPNGILIRKRIEVLVERRHEPDAEPLDDARRLDAAEVVVQPLAAGIVRPVMLDVEPALPSPLGLRR